MNLGTKNILMRTIIKLFTTKDKEKILNGKRNETHYIHMNKDKEDSRFFVRNNTSQKTNLKNLKSTENKNFQSRYPYVAKISSKNKTLFRYTSVK